MIKDLLRLLFPRLCAACDRPLQRWDKTLCMRCMLELPLTRFHEDPENKLAQIFWGRVYLEQVVAWFYFRKGSRYQQVMHLFKYQDQPQIGVDLGKAFGYHLDRSEVFSSPDVIVPVPLHPGKLRKRGYNQSERIARGLSQAMEKPVVSNNLVRSDQTSTQTTKSRFDRYLNVSGHFMVKDPLQLQNKHILLVDDIITTGATIEACAEQLLKIEGVRVSVAALAWTEGGK